MALKLARAVDQAAPVQVRARDCLVFQAPAVRVALVGLELPRDQRLTTTISLLVALAGVVPAVAADGRELLVTPVKVCSQGEVVDWVLPLAQVHWYFQTAERPLALPP